MILSKSQFVKGVKCPKLLWHLKRGNIPKAEPDAALEALFEEGIDVGRLARGLFPGGREVLFDLDDFPGMIRQTREWIDAGVPVIYEAAAQAKGGFAMADILHRRARGWELYEVKATGGVKDYHLYDAGFQFRVFRDFGLEIGKVTIIHIDTSYVRHGELEIDRLFAIENITSQVIEMQGEIEQTYRLLWKCCTGKNRPWTSARTATGFSSANTPRCAGGISRTARCLTSTVIPGMKGSISITAAF